MEANEQFYFYGGERRWQGRLKGAWPTWADKLERMTRRTTEGIGDFYVPFVPSAGSDELAASPAE